MSERSVPSAGPAQSLFPDRPCILSPDLCSTGSRPVPLEATWRPGPSGSTCSPRRVAKSRSTLCLSWRLWGKDHHHQCNPFLSLLRPPHQQRTRTVHSWNSVVLGHLLNWKPIKTQGQIPIHAKARTDSEVLAVGGGIKDKGSWEQSPEAVCLVASWVGLSAVSSLHSHTTSLKWGN